MRRLAPVLASIAVLSFSPRVWAQQGDALIQKEGAFELATGVTFPAPKDATYRLAWGINAAPDEEDGVVSRLRRPAHFLFLADHNGVPRKNVRLAVVVWHDATYSLLRNDAYKALKGTDNRTIPLLEALHQAGVEVIACGEAVAVFKLRHADLLPFVKVAPSAMMALATLHTQGYVSWLPPER